MLSVNFIKHINKLQQKKYRAEFKELLIEGFKGVEEAVLSDAKVVFIVIDSKNKEGEKVEKIKNEATRKNIEVVFCDKKDTDKIKRTCAQFLNHPFILLQYEVVTMVLFHVPTVSFCNNSCDAMA